MAKKSRIKVWLQKSNRVVFLLDCLEEHRTLTGPEFIFRKLVKLHIEKLLHWQSLYWKKICTKRYIKVGEENLKFFQAMASERLRRKSISTLQLDDGTPCSDHSLLPAAFWSSFKNRMGISHGIQM